MATLYKWKSYTKASHRNFDGNSQIEVLYSFEEQSNIMNKPSACTAIIFQLRELCSFDEVISSLSSLSQHQSQHYVFF